MASFNKIIIVGYLGRDPELRYVGDGSMAVCSFSVATTEKRKGRDGAEESTTWFKLTAWGKLAETCNQYLKKGSQVYAEGRLGQVEYVDKDGNKRASLEVRLSEIQFLGKAGEGESQPASQPPARSAKGFAVGQGGRVSSPAIDDSDDSIPFNWLAVASLA